MKKILAISLAFVLLFALCSCSIKSSLSEEEVYRIQKGIVGMWQSEDSTIQMYFTEEVDGVSGSCVYGVLNKETSSYDETIYEYSTNGKTLYLLNGDITMEYDIYCLTDDNTRLILNDTEGKYIVFQACIA